MRFELLDHGYLELIETWGSDQSIIEAARMSTDKGFLGWGPIQKFTCREHGFLEPYQVRKEDGSWLHGKCNEFVSLEEKPGDEKLLAYLWKHEHATPFEMAGITIEVKAPIMVFREWHRHRTQSFNEMSARYVPLPNENYLPTAVDLVERSAKAAATTNRQASGTGKIMTEEQAFEWLEHLDDLYDRAQLIYSWGLQLGVPKELARLPVPVARYSRMRATANLRNWLGFMKLRAAPTAQKEIRVYAEALGEIIREKFPRTWALYADKT